MNSLIISRGGPSSLSLTGRLQLHAQPRRAALLCALCAMALSSTALAQDEEEVEDGKEEAEIKTEYSAMPVDGADAEERIIFQFEGGLDLMFSDFNEEDGKVLFPEGTEVGLGVIDAEDSIRAQTTFVFGNIKAGTRKLILPTLNTYLSASLGFDVDGAPNPQADDDGLFLPNLIDPIEDGSEHRFTSTPQGDLGFFLHQAYAELEGFSDEGAGKQFSLRAGRQSHWGIGSIMFDGATVGFTSESGAFNLAARGGQRSPIYERTQDDPGLFGGLTLALDLEPGSNVPLAFKAEYALFTRTLTLSERDIERRGIEEENFTLNLVDVAAYLDPTDNLLISARLQMTDANPSHIRNGVRMIFSDAVSLNLETDLKIADGLPYDMTGGRGIKVIDQRTGFERTATHEVLRLNIPDRQPYFDAQLQLPINTSEALEIIPRGGAHIVFGDAENLSPYDATSFNFGLGAYIHSKISREATLETQVEYDATLYDRTDLVDAGLMSDPRAAPENQVHRIFLGARYDRGRRLSSKMLQMQKRTMSLGLGIYANISLLEFRPYINTVIEDLGIDATDPDNLADINDLGEAEAAFETEVMFGAQAYFKYWATEFTALQLTYEFAQDSEVFLTHMAAFNALRLTADITF